MAVGHVVTHGFGTGTLAGTVALAVTHGFSIGAAVTASLVLAAIRIRTAVAGEPGSAPAVAGAPVVNGDV